jgi:hypothetical protein
MPAQEEGVQLIKLKAPLHHYDLMTQRSCAIHTWETVAQGRVNMARNVP